MTALSICSAAASIIYLNGYFLTDQTAPREIRSFSGYSLRFADTAFPVNDLRGNPPRAEDLKKVALLQITHVHQVKQYLQGGRFFGFIEFLFKVLDESSHEAQ